MVAAAPRSGSRSTAHTGVVSVVLGSGVVGEWKGRGGSGGRLGLSLQLQGDFWSEGIYLGWPPLREDYVLVVGNVQLSRIVHIAIIEIILLLIIKFDVVMPDSVSIRLVQCTANKQDN